MSPKRKGCTVVIEPTKDQIEVQDSTARFNVVVGNAGAAKTMTLAMTIRKRLLTGCGPGELMVLTYTTAAVSALRQRLRWLGLRPDEVRAVRVMTFAELCHELLIPFEGASRHLEGPNRLVHNTLVEAVAMARDRAERHGQADSFELDGDGVLAFPLLLHAFRLMKGTMVLQTLGDEFVLTPESAQDVGLDFTQAAIFRAYEYLRRGRIGAQEIRRDEDEGSTKEELESRFRLDDDPVHDMAALLEANDPVYTDLTHPLKLGIRYLFVDEGHDLNKTMFTVLQHMVSVNPVQQLYVVGDPDQVIHSDTGAERRFMSDTLSFGNSARRFHLPLCRRFGGNLASPLGVFAAKPYEFLSTNETVVAIYKAGSHAAVASYMIGAHARATEVDPERVASVAVLLRHPGRSVQLENTLALEGFHVEANGFEPYMERPEVHFVRTLVAWAAEAMDTLSRANLLAIQSALGEFTGYSNHARVTGVQHKSVATLTTYVFGASPAAFLSNQEAHLRPPPLLYLSDFVATKAIRRFLAAFLAGTTTASLSTLIDEADFRPLAKRAFVFEERVDEAMEAMRAFARSAATFTDFRSWLQQMANREYAAASQARGTRPVLRMYTISAAKGLEFDHVFIPDVDGHSFDGRSQEERNLFYVAASRARRELTMTYRALPSTFLEPFQDCARWDELH